MAVIVRVLQFALLLNLALPGLSRAESTLEVVVSVEPQRWLVQKIGGEEVAVEVLVQPGESPATYMPTDAQVTSLMRATLYFRIGVPFEKGPWFAAVSKLERLTIVDLRQGVAMRGDDPHIWLSPRLLSVQAQTVADALSKADPGHRLQYQDNLANLVRQLADLDARIHRQLGPFSGQEFFVFHPSWGYFASDHGLEQVAIEVGGREPSDSELTALQQRARRVQATTVFVQPQIQGRSARAFAESIDARLEVLDPLAADVDANLIRTADKLVRAFSEESPGER